MSILFLGNSERALIMSAEGSEWEIITYDYQQVVKLYLECKRLATLFFNYTDSYKNCPDRQVSTSDGEML